MEEARGRGAGEKRSDEVGRNDEVGEEGIAEMTTSAMDTNVPETHDAAYAQGLEDVLRAFPTRDAQGHLPPSVVSPPVPSFLMRLLIFMAGIKRRDDRRSSGFTVPQDRPWERPYVSPAFAQPPILCLLITPWNRFWRATKSHLGPELYLPKSASAAGGDGCRGDEAPGEGRSGAGGGFWRIGKYEDVRGGF